MENFTICCSFIHADRLCFQPLTRGNGPTHEVDSKQIQLLYLSINMLEICFKHEQSLPDYRDDVWGFELHAS